MKFRCFGGRDCPDWVLAEVVTLSRLTSIRTKLVCQLLCKTINSDDQSKLDLEKLKSLTSNAKFSSSDVEAVSAALTFVLTSCGRHDNKPEDVTNELQQLGLPKEHSTAIGKVYGEHKSKIRETLAKSSLIIGSDPCIESWEVHKVTGEDLTAVNLAFKDLKVAMTPIQLRVLLKNLETAQSTMQKLDD